MSQYVDKCVHCSDVYEEAYNDGHEEGFEEGYDVGMNAALADVDELVDDRLRERELIDVYGLLESFIPNIKKSSYEFDKFLEWLDVNFDGKIGLIQK